MKQWLSEEDWIDLFKARQYDLKADLQSNASGNGASEFDRAWVETGEEEERSNPFSRLDPQDKETAETIHCRRKSIAKRIVNLEDEALAGLAQRDAKARHEARNMLRAYYQYGACLQCPKWLGMFKTDARTDELLRHLVALIISVGEPVPACLQGWASAALFVDRPKHPGRRKMNWCRDQKITLAVDVLVEMTHSSVGNALSIVSEVCRESGVIDMDADGIKTIRDRVRREAKEGEADAAI